MRFKGGDNFVFGRGSEELLACLHAGIETRVVPGVSSAIAAPALAGIPVTHRGLTQGFTVISGHVPPGHPESTLDYAALATSGTTIVVLMGVRTLSAICAALVDGGLDPETPAAVIADGTMPSQRVVRATLATIDEAAADLGAPAVAVIGDVADIPGSTAARVILWVRHGQSTWNVIDRMQGHELSPPLTELGREQAALTAELLADRGVVRILSSPAVRARETADIIAERLGLDVVEEPLLLEKGLDEDKASVLARIRQLLALDLPGPTVAVSHGDTIGLRGRAAHRPPAATARPTGPSPTSIPRLDRSRSRCPRMTPSEVEEAGAIPAQ